MESLAWMGAEILMEASLKRLALIGSNGFITRK